MLKRKYTKPTVLVTDAERGSAVAIIRSLGRSGWRVIAASSNGFAPGFYSRHTCHKLLHSPPERAPGQFVETLFETARRRDVDLIIPVSDAAILPLSDARAQFQDVCQITLPTAKALDVVTDKLKTIQLAQQLAVTVPRTRFARTIQDAIREGPKVGWPVVMKPQRSRLYRGRQTIESLTVTYAMNQISLIEQMRQFEGRCPVLLQEYVRGRGCGVELLMCEGQPLAAFQHMRLREVPVHGGQSALRESVPLDAKLYDNAVRLLRELAWSGLAMVEFKMGRHGPVLMEINGRVWGSLPLAVQSGMDFPTRLAEMWLFGPPAAKGLPDTSYCAGIRARHLELYIKWITSVLLGRNSCDFLPMPHRSESFAAVAELFHPLWKYDTFSFADPQPGLADMIRIVTKFAAKLQRKPKRTCHDRVPIRPSTYP